MDERYVLAIDQGTTSTRAAVRPRQARRRLRAARLTALPPAGLGRARRGFRILASVLTTIAEVLTVTHPVQAIALSASPTSAKPS